MHVSPEFIGLCVVAVVAALDRYGLLDRFKKKSAVDAAGELAIAERTIERLRDERNQARVERQKLAETRSLEPVLEQLNENAKLQAEVLDRLIHHNGSFKHMEESMGEIREGLRILTGFIAGVAEIPMRQGDRGGS